MFKVDHREGKLKELFVSQNISCDFENLVHGDFQLLNASSEIVFIFERKTLDDLLASIKDGRYKNQKARLFGVYKPSQIFYIIEGNLSYCEPRNVTDKILQSSVINTMLRDNIACFFTKNVKDTFDLLCGIVRRFREDPSKYQGSAETKEQISVETSRTSSPTQVFKSMLCQLPGASEKSAEAVVHKWATFRAMYEELGTLDVCEKTKRLIEVKLDGGRKISKKVIESILTHLF